MRIAEVYEKQSIEYENERARSTLEWVHDYGTQNSKHKWLKSTKALLSQCLTLITATQGHMVSCLSIITGKPRVQSNYDTKRTATML